MMSSIMLPKKVCIQCGSCCTQLSWDERLKISWHTKTFMFSRVCKFLNVEDEFRRTCSINDNKPSICKNFYCGVDIFMDELIGSDMFDWKEL